MQSGLDMLADAGLPDVAMPTTRRCSSTAPLIDEAPAVDAHVEDDWSHAAPEDHHLEADDSGFDIFDYVSQEP